MLILLDNFEICCVIGFRVWSISLVFPSDFEYNQTLYARIVQVVNIITLLRFFQSSWKVYDYSKVTIYKIEIIRYEQVFVAYK